MATKGYTYLNKAIFLPSGFVYVIITFFVPVFKPLATNVPHHNETSQLICIANQLAGFHMMGKIYC